MRAVLRLGQLLAYLDRDGISELVLGSGRPITVKKGSAYQPLIAAPISTAQLEELVRGSELAALLPDRDTNGAPVAVRVLGKPCRVQVARRGASIIIKIGTSGETSGKTSGAERPDPVHAAAAPLAAPAPGTLDLDDNRDDDGRDDDGRGEGSAQDEIDLEIDLSPMGDPPGDGLAAAPAPVPAAAPAPVPAAAPAPPAAAALRLAAARVIPEAFAALVRAARRHDATDLHLAPGQPPLVRVVGQLHHLGDPLDAAAVAAMIEPWLGLADRAALEQRGYVDLALELPADLPSGDRGGGSRLRANVSRQRGGWKASFRVVWEGVPTLERLGLPRDLVRVTSYHQGLVVIAGPSGHGKTTTLAALVDLINSSRPHHILCIEDPIEIVHPRKVALVSQREVGHHTLSFASALKASLREDPDVIVIGEVRDRETVEIALTAAETGHLVIVTMSTPSAARTIDRLIDMFPPGDQPQVRVSLAAALRFILAQRLLPRRGGDGVVPAVELLTGVLPLAALIRDNKLFQLPNLQQRGRAFGMIRFDDSILELVRAGVIDTETAIAAAESKREMHAALHPPDPAAAPPPLPKPWDDARQRLGGLFKRGDKDRERE